MNIIKYNTASLPPFWWLNPWGHASTLHQALGAVTRAYCEHDEKVKAYRKGLVELERRIKLRDMQIASLRSQLAEYREARGENN